MASFSSSDGIYIPTFTQSIVLLASIVSATVYLLSKALFYRRPVDRDGNAIPTGPIGLPILGTFSRTPPKRHDLVTGTGSFPFLTNYPELTLDYWAKKFGPIYSMWLGNQLFVVVSDPQIVKDLMVVNGAIFSSRKEMFLKSQTIFAGRGITATPYNDRWYVRRSSDSSSKHDANRILINAGEHTAELPPVR